MRGSWANSPGITRNQFNRDLPLNRLNGVEILDTLPLSGAAVS
jgi:hypothetical protein